MLSAWDLGFKYSNVRGDSEHSHDLKPIFESVVWRWENGTDKLWKESTWEYTHQDNRQLRISSLQAIWDGPYDKREKKKKKRSMVRWWNRKIQKVLQFEGLWWQIMSSKWKVHEIHQFQVRLSHIGVERRPTSMEHFKISEDRTIHVSGYASVSRDMFIFKNNRASSETRMIFPKDIRLQWQCRNQSLSLSPRGLSRVEIPVLPCGYMAWMWNSRLHADEFPV